MLAATLAHAECPQPAAVDAARADAGEIRHYLAALDAYAACVKSASATLPPLDREAAVRQYDAVFPLMQQAVDFYNAAHRAGS